ncbi:hypothetical protein [Longimicrobium sp.]|jgi:hypothetical protein|uniref:hypothetical protein n=1 Tax=Longimicrobium sp. TaxID=2029185 RepID=UPI002F931432
MSRSGTSAASGIGFRKTPPATLRDELMETVGRWPVPGTSPHDLGITADMGRRALRLYHGDGAPSDCADIAALLAHWPVDAVDPEMAAQARALYDRWIEGRYLIVTGERLVTHSRHEVDR